MYFNEVNKINLNLPSTLKKKEKGVDKKNAETQKNDTPVENSPANPSYWQNAAGVKHTNRLHSTYINIDTSNISNIKTNAQIQLNETETVPLSEYTKFLLTKPVGFTTEKEYQEYVLETFTTNLASLKSAFETQSEQDGIISKAYNSLKELTGLGTSSKDVEETIAKQEAIIKGLNDALNGKSEMSFEEAYEHFTGVPYSKEKIDEYLATANIYSAMMVGCMNDDDYIDKFKQTTGKSVEEVTKDYARCQLDTFGKATGVEDLAQKFTQDQQGFTDKLSSIISTAGLTCLAVGAIASFAFPPAGMSLMVAGKYISLSGMFIDNALDLVNNATDKDGLTKSEISSLAMETGVEAVSYGVGQGIGRFTGGLNTFVSGAAKEAGINKVASYIAGQATETTIDMALSLGADYMIAQGQSFITTGQFMNSEDYWSIDRFLGEGKNQLIGILTGLSSAKLSTYQKNIMTTAQDKILAGDTEGARAFLQKSGMKMNDANFEQFIKQVNEAKLITDTLAGGKKITETEPPQPDTKTGEVEVSDKTPVSDTTTGNVTQTPESKPIDTTETGKTVTDTQTTDEIPRIKTTTEADTITLDFEQSQTVRRLQDSGFSEKFATACALNKFSEEQIQIAQTLKSSEFDDGSCFYFARKGITATQAETAKTLKQLGFDNETSLTKAFELEPAKANTLIELRKAGFRQDNSIVILEQDCSPERLDTAIKLKKLGASDTCAFKNSEIPFTVDEFAAILSLKKSGCNPNNAVMLSKRLNQTELQNAIKLLEANFNSNNILTLVKNKDCETILEKVIALKKDGFEDNDAIVISYMQDELIAIVKEAKSKGLDGRDSISAARKKYTSQQIDNEVALKKSNFGTMARFKMMKSFSNEQITAAITLRNGGFDEARSIEIAEKVSNPQEIQTIASLKKVGLKGKDALEIAYKIHNGNYQSDSELYNALRLNELSINSIKLLESMGFDKTSAIIASYSGLSTTDALNIYQAVTHYGFDKDEALKWVIKGVKGKELKALKLYLEFGLEEAFILKILPKDYSFSDTEIETIKRLKKANFDDASAFNIAREAKTLTDKEIIEIDTLARDGNLWHTTAYNIYTDAGMMERYEKLADLDINPDNIPDLLKTMSLTEIDEIIADAKEFKKIVQEHHKSTGGESPRSNMNINIRNLQYDTGNQALTTLSWDFEDITITLQKRRNPDGSVEYSRTEMLPKGESISWFKDRNSLFNSVHQGRSNKLEAQTEMVYDQNTGEPVAVLFSTPSTEIKGAYEVTRYELKDYPDDYNIVENIVNGTITGGKKISTVTRNNDGSSTYVENINTNGSTTQREYTVQYNGRDYNYHYEITDETGSKILRTDFEFKREAVNKSKTTINGIEYITTFDDDSFIITITGSDGSYKTFDLEAIASKDLDKCWEAVKGLPANLLTTLSSAKRWDYTDDDLDSHYRLNDHSVQLKSNLQVVAHELGHLRDYATDLRKDKDLIKIYKDEIAKFNSRFTTQAGRKYINYFSLEGGSASTGLAEMIAETHSILCTYGNNLDRVESRAHFLAQNFPKTIAYIATKFGMNSVDSK